MAHHATEFDVEIREVSFRAARKGHGVFIDGSGQPIEGTEFKIVSVTQKNVALCRSENDLMNVPSNLVQVSAEEVDDGR